MLKRAIQKSANAISVAAGFARFAPLYMKYRRDTMIPGGRFIDNVMLAKSILARPELASGAVVECGTWRGGMAAALMEVGGPKRRYYFFDSFEGLPPVDPVRDGAAAAAWQKNTDSPFYYNNATASLDEFRLTIARAGVSETQIEIHKGFFENTLPKFKSPPIAVLRLDADWYSSTTICLENFWDHVLPGGLVLIDDYEFWEGCTRAVHRFLASRDAPEAIRRTAVGNVCYIIKDKH